MGLTLPAKKKSPSQSQKSTSNVASEEQHPSLQQLAVQKPVQVVDVFASLDIGMSDMKSEQQQQQEKQVQAQQVQQAQQQQAHETAMQLWQSQQQLNALHQQAQKRAGELLSPSSPLPARLQAVSALAQLITEAAPLEARLCAVSNAEPSGANSAVFVARGALISLVRRATSWPTAAEARVHEDVRCRWRCGEWRRSPALDV